MEDDFEFDEMNGDFIVSPMITTMPISNSPASALPNKHLRFSDIEPGPIEDNNNNVRTMDSLTFSTTTTGSSSSSLGTDGIEDMPVNILTTSTIGSLASNTNSGNVMNDITSFTTNVNTVVNSSSSSSAVITTSTTNGNNGGEAIQVCLRIRPLTEKEYDQNPEPTISIVSDNKITVKAPETSHAFRNGEKSGTFSFSKVFDPNINQESFYTSVFNPIVTKAIKEGHHGLLFAYGMTGGGKTYTILGTPTAPGILPRTLSSIFTLLPSISSSASSTNITTLSSSMSTPKFIVSVTYVEIYNEGVYDLLSSMGNGTSTSSTTSTTTLTMKGNNNMNGGRNAANSGGGQQLKIMNDKEGRIFVAGAKQITVPSKEAAMLVLAEGSRNKTHQETALNADSSRSHSVFSISIWKNDFMNDNSSSTSSSSTVTDPNAPIIQDIIGNKGDIATGYSLWSRLSIVDLAGSERADRTGTVGAQTKEAGKINTSLMYLMQCLETMRENARLRTLGKENSVKPVPIRNSKLTYMFGDYLGGSTSGSTVMIVNAGPGAADYDETLQAVKYGAVVKDVKVTKDRVNTRWEPGQYGLDGRKVNNKRKAENETNAENNDNTTTATTKGGNKKATVNPAGMKSSTMNSNKAVLSSTGGSSLSGTMKSTSSSVNLNATGSTVSPSKRIRMSNSSGNEEDDEFLQAHTDEHIENDGVVLAGSVFSVEAAAELARISEELVRTREEKQTMEARVLTLETQIVEIQDEMRHLELTKIQLEEEIEEAHDLAASIEDDTRNEMAAAMDEELRNKDNFWQAKLAKEKAEAKETITKIHDLMKIHSKRSGSKRGSSISGLLKDLIGLPLASGSNASSATTTTITTHKSNRRATAEYSNRPLQSDGTLEDYDDNDASDDDLDDEENVAEYHEVYEQRIQELETKLSSTLTELDETRKELEIMNAEIAEIEATYAVKVEELEHKVEELRNQVVTAEQDATEKSRAAAEASMAAADAAEATAEAREAANTAKDRANIAETIAADLRTAVANAEANIAALRSSIVVKDNELESLRNSLSEAREDHAAVEEELTTVKTNMEILQRDNEEIKQQHDQVAGAMEVYKEKLAEKDEKITFFMNAIENMQTKNAKDNEEIVTLRASLLQAQQQQPNTNTIIASTTTATSEVLTLRTEVTSLRTALAQNATETANAREQVSETTSRLLATQAAHTALSKELEIVTVAKETAVTTAQNLRNEMETLRSTVTDLENRLRLTQATLDETNAALEYAKQQQQTITTVVHNPVVVAVPTMVSSTTQTVSIETNDTDMNTDTIESTTSTEINQSSTKPRSRFSEFFTKDVSTVEVDETMVSETKPRTLPSLLTASSNNNSTLVIPTVVTTNEEFDAQPNMVTDEIETAIATEKPKRSSKGSRAASRSQNGNGRRSRALSVAPSENESTAMDSTTTNTKTDDIPITSLSSSVETNEITQLSTAIPPNTKVNKGQGTKDDSTTVSKKVMNVKGGTSNPTTTAQTAVMARLASPLRSPSGRMMMMSPTGGSAGIGPRGKVGIHKAPVSSISSIIQRSTTPATATSTASISTSKQTVKPIDLIGSPMMEVSTTTENKAVVPTGKLTTITTKTTVTKSSSKITEGTENVQPSRTPITSRLRSRK